MPPRRRKTHEPHAPATSDPHAALPWSEQIPGACPRAGQRASRLASRGWLCRFSRIDHAPVIALHADGTHLIAICALWSIPPTMPLLRRIAMLSCSEDLALFSVAATTRPEGQFEE